VRFSANVTLPRESAAKVDKLLTPGALARVIASESSSLCNTSGTSSAIMAPTRSRTAKSVSHREAALVKVPGGALYD